MSAAGIFEAHQQRQLKNQLTQANARIEALLAERNDRATRELIVRDLIPLYGTGAVAEAEKIVRYIVNGPKDA